MPPLSTPTSDRRESLRVPYRVRAVLSSRLGEVSAEVVDISVGGLAIEITGELRIFDFVRVLLPLASDDDAEWIDPDALVARVHGKAGPGRSRLGLTFFELPPATLRRIAACVANNRLHEPPAVAVPAARVEPERPRPATMTPPPASSAATRELPKAAPAPAKRRSATPKRETAPTPKAPPLHIPRTSARELRTLFHDAVASLEEDTDRKNKPR